MTRSFCLYQFDLVTLTIFGIGHYLEHLVFTSKFEVFKYYNISIIEEIISDFLYVQMPDRIFFLCITDEEEITEMSEGYVTVALGNTWSHNVNTRLILQYLDDDKRQVSSPNITENEIKFFVIDLDDMSIIILWFLCHDLLPLIFVRHHVSSVNKFTILTSCWKLHYRLLLFLAQLS